MTSMHHARDPQAAEIAAAAARLTGTPEQLAERLRALLDAGPPKAVPRETPEQRVDRLADTRRHELDVAALRHRLASDFAEARGLAPTTAPMSRKELARRATPGGKWHKAAREWPADLRRTEFFRDVATRRAAAMTAHIVPGEMAPDAVEAWAHGFDLMATCPDFPSWDHPGLTVLVILEPAEPLAPRVPPAEEPVRADHVAPPATSAAEPSGPVPATPGQPDPTPADDVHPDPAPSTAPSLPEMRPIAPIDLAGAEPRDLSGEVGPDFDIVAPADLLVDESYQRGLGPKSLDLIRRIVRTWSWSKFKPPVCVRVDGRFHVLDGQHTAIAAASHGGIGAIPIVVIAGDLEVSDRAAAFVSHATARLQATALQVHRAALVAGDEEAVTLDTVCRRAEAELLPFAPSDGRYAPRQTVAVVGLRKLIARRGPDKAAEILSALAAADLAPIAGDHIRLGEVLLCDPIYADAFDAERLTAAMRGLTAKTHAEARELAIAQRLPVWRALAAVLTRNSKAGASRRRAGA